MLEETRLVCDTKLFLKVLAVTVVINMQNLHFHR